MCQKAVGNKPVGWSSQERWMTRRRSWERSTPPWPSSSRNTAKPNQSETYCERWHFPGPPPFSLQTTFNQCCGSGAGSWSIGSVSFWDSPGSGSNGTRYGSESFYNHAKIEKPWFLLLCIFFMIFNLWKMMWCSLKSNEQKNFLKKLGCHLEVHWRKWQDPAPDPESEPDQNPDPLVRGTDPRIWIRAKMSRIRNTAYNVIQWK
jgi:hypothetical protein